MNAASVTSVVPTGQKTKQGFGVIYDVTMKKTKENMRKFFVFV